jgi:putative pre-16S rRNA nuclease
MLLRKQVMEVSISCLMTTIKPQHQPTGPILALDLGQELVGAAISDALLITIRRLAPLKRSSWKRLVREVETLIQRFDAKTLVIGLPLRLDGTAGDAAVNIARLAANFARSLQLPVYLQDERLTSFEARQVLLSEGHAADDIPALIDGESAALILRDFLANKDNRRPALARSVDEDR